MANEIDRMFGTEVSGGFKGQISQASDTGMQAARQAAKGNTLEAAKAGTATVKNLFGKEKQVNEKNAFKAIRNLLKEGAE